ncbi:MAG: T9SS type A sorting domain-containing protein [Bacteroidales bacterium]|nr:T9SS type A sorting domain-containing protein [Bacteroidales bacterium]
MKKLLLMATALLFACTADLFAQQGGETTQDGSQEHPFLIANEDDFLAIANDPDKGAGKYYKQTENITLTTKNVSSKDAYYIPNFKGIYDGNAKSITYSMNVSLPANDRGSYVYIGLFDTLESGVIKNLIIINSSITITTTTKDANTVNGQEWYTGLVGGLMLKNSSVANCRIEQSYIDASNLHDKMKDATYMHIAGVIGHLKGGSLYEVSFSYPPKVERPYALKGVSCVGGLVGKLDGTDTKYPRIIEKCLFRGSLYVERASVAPGVCNVCGIVGRTQNAAITTDRISNCYVDAPQIISGESRLNDTEAAAAGITIAPTNGSMNIYHCYVNVGEMSVLPNTGYCYPIAGPAKNSYNPQHRCEYSAAKIGDNYYCVETSAYPPSMDDPLTEEEKAAIYRADDILWYPGDAFIYNNGEIVLRSTVQGHIYSNRDGEFNDPATWLNYPDEFGNVAINPNCWGSISSIEIKHNVTLRASQSGQRPQIGGVGKIVPITIVENKSLIVEDAQADFSHAHITIEDGGSFVDATATSARGVIQKYIYGGVWNFVGMAGHQNMEPLHDRYMTEKPFNGGTLRFWALGYDYTSGVWDEEHYLLWSDEVGKGEGVLIYTNSDHVLVQIDDTTKTYNESGEVSTIQDVFFENGDVQINKTIAQSENGNWLALANPYPARLDVGKVLSGIADGNNGAIQGGYVYVRDGNNPAWTTKSSGTIEAAQGFFVNFASSGEKSVTLKKNMLANYPQQSSESPSKSESGAGKFLKVSVASEGYRVPVMYRQNDAASAEYDIFDADKLFGSGTVAEPYFALGERMLCKQEADSTHFVADLNIRSEQSRSVEIIAEYIPEGYTLSLIDDNNETEMNQDDVYTADIARGDNEGRFKLVINKNNVSIEDVANVEEIKFYNNNRQITISGGNVKLVQVYNTLGQKVYETKQRTFTLDEVASGTYIVNVQTDETSFSNKIVVH